MRSPKELQPFQMTDHCQTRTHQLDELEKRLFSPSLKFCLIDNINNCFLGFASISLNLIAKAGIV
ncbi:MAG: hypothetical protein C4323_15625 [Mastigocladus sp. ERB_26_2]